MTTATLIVGCGGAGEVERGIALLAADRVVGVVELLGLGLVVYEREHKLI
jgi:hypothetical protein